MYSSSLSLSSRLRYPPPSSSEPIPPTFPPDLPPRAPTAIRRPPRLRRRRRRRRRSRRWSRHCYCYRYCLSFAQNILPYLSAREGRRRRRGGGIRFTVVVPFRTPRPSLSDRIRFVVRVCRRQVRLLVFVWGNRVQLVPPTGTAGGGTTTDEKTSQEGKGEVIILAKAVHKRGRFLPFANILCLGICESAVEEII